MSMYPKMNPDVKAKWLAALRSGNYTQGTGALCRVHTHGDRRFCCLGVLADVMGTNWVDPAPNELSCRPALDCNYKADGEYLSRDALNRAGLTYDTQETLTHMNDHVSEGDNTDLDGNLIGDQDDYTFADIADQIEHNL